MTWSTLEAISSGQISIPIVLWTALFVPLTGLASWRISHMLVYEYGPFGIFQWVRSLFGIRHTARGEIVTFSHRNVLNCVWCTSVWVALALSLLVLWSISAALIVILIFAVASVPPLIELVTEWSRMERNVSIHNHVMQAPTSNTAYGSINSKLGEMANNMPVRQGTAWDNLPAGVKHGGGGARSDTSVGTSLTSGTFGGGS